ncbi:hypothetical protein [Rhodococcus sp. 27YEA15]|uniref:hypothetical protein n=1 Tax=Rhodococcus sp. 27YEA15 TaxID=3156259 RepID=UPI003C7A8C72
MLVDGIVVKTGSVVSMSGSQTVDLSLSTDPISVSTGQIVTVQIQGRHGYLEVQGGADTWVHIDRQPLGMTKNGDWVPTANGSWLAVPAWAADPGATVSGNGVQPRDAKPSAIISGQLSVVSRSGLYAVDVRLKLDGTVVKTITDFPLDAWATTNVPISSGPIAVAVGQVATIECRFVNWANAFTIQPGANTYVRIT